MENTARKLSAQELVNEFKERDNNLDFLRVFLITNSADIIRNYEFISKLCKNASAAERAIYESALKTLINVSLKRIEYTDTMYQANNSINAIAVTEEESNNQPEAKRIMMLPVLDELIVRAKAILTKDNNTETNTKEAFELLKTTVGQGKIINNEGKPETWNNDTINNFIKDSSPEVNETTNTTEVEGFGFEKAYDHLVKMIEEGKQANEIKESLKTLLIGKTIKSTNEDNNYFIKDETIFEDYYTRIIENVVLQGIIAFNHKSENAKAPEADKTVGKKEAVLEEVTKEVTPLLENLEKDETQTSISPVTRQIRDLYQKKGLPMTLRDAWFIATELAKKIAPSLYTRNKDTKKTSIPTVVEDKEVTTEIYDDSHNIIESNKPLWAEVEKYEYLDQLFTKGVELSKAGFWKDALSMSTILISSGKIKETKDSTEALKWDTDQIKLWYHNVVELAVTQPEKPDTIDAVAEIVEDKKEESTEVKIGPVPQVGSIGNTVSTKLLKDDSLWKETYAFKDFTVKTSHSLGGTMTFQIVDATPEQEKDLLITEANFTKFLDEQRDILVKIRNNQPQVRKTLVERLSAFYDVNNSEIKRIVENLVKEADVIRKEAKLATKEVVEPSTEQTENPTKGDEVASPPEEPVTKNEESPEPALEQSPSENSTNDVTGDNTANSNKPSYDGFEDILKAKDKLTLHKAIFAKVSEYKTNEEGIKAVYDVIDHARKDTHYKKSLIHNWKPTPPVELLSRINRIVTTGLELNKSN